MLILKIKCCKYYNIGKWLFNRLKLANVVKITTDFWQKLLKNKHKYDTMKLVQNKTKTGQTKMQLKIPKIKARGLFGRLNGNF